MNEEHNSQDGERFAENHGADLALVAQYRGGDNAAAAQLYRQYAAGALLLAQKTAPSPDVAQEFVSEAFLKTFEAIRNGKGPSDSFRGYLLTSVRSVSANWHRRSPKDLSLEQLASGGEIDVEAPETVSAMVDARSAIMIAFQRLPQRWKEILYWRIVEHRSYAELAEKLSLRVSAVSQLYDRAREGLRKEYLLAVASEQPRNQCGTDPAQLAKYAHGSLSKLKQRNISQHLSICEPCERDAALLLAIAEKFHKLPLAETLIVAGGAVLGSELAALFGSNASSAHARTLTEGGAEPWRQSTARLLRFNSKPAMLLAGGLALSASVVALIGVVNNESARSEESIFLVSGGACEATVTQRTLADGSLSVLVQSVSPPAVESTSPLTNDTQQSGCSVQFSRVGAEPQAAQTLDQHRVFVAARQGEYRVTLFEHGQTVAQHTLVR